MIPKQTVLTTVYPIEYRGDETELPSNPGNFQVGDEMQTSIWDMVHQIERASLKTVAHHHR